MYIIIYTLFMYTFPYLPYLPYLSRVCIREGRKSLRCLH